MASITTTVTLQLNFDEANLLRDLLSKAGQTTDDIACLWQSLSNEEKRTIGDIFALLDTLRRE